MLRYRDIVGKRIVCVIPNKTRDPRGVIYNPIIFLDDGSSLHFRVQESENAGYGVEIIRGCPKRKK